MTETPRYRLSRRAARDLERLLQDGEAKFGAERAIGYFDALVDTFEKIANAPYVNRARMEFAPPARVAHFRAHIVLYQVLPDGVLIVRVRHGREDWTPRP